MAHTKDIEAALALPHIFQRVDRCRGMMALVFHFVPRFFYSGDSLVGSVPLSIWKQKKGGRENICCRKYIHAQAA